jgi:hypothetical protein
VNRKRFCEKRRKSLLASRVFAAANNTNLSVPLGYLLVNKYIF